MNVKLDNLYDVVIIGGGPAGLTAALYLARARYRVLVVEKEHFGGQITITSEVVNYPGVERVSGEELTKTMQKQAESFGAEFLISEVNSLEVNNDIKVVKTSSGDLSCLAILLATGANPRRLGFKGEEEFRGRGVAYCATCDGEFFTGKDVFVIGGGFAAAEESVFLTKYAKSVQILIRGDDFTAPPSVCEHALKNEKITIHRNTVVESVSGDTALKSLTYKNIKTNEVTKYQAKDNETFGVFVFAGYEPATKLVKDLAECNESGYIITNNSQQTSVTGLYAAGDVCIKPLRQVVTAVGEAALAATEMEKYLCKMQEKLNVQPKQQNVSKVEKNSSNSEHKKASEATNQNSELFTQDMLTQLHTVFEKMTSSLQLKLYLNNEPVSAELEGYINELTSLTDKLSMEVIKDLENSDVPCVKICKEDGTETGLSFHGVPGGHEFGSFVLSLYNAAGPGQPIDAVIKEKIESLDTLEIKVLVSLSCTLCPELVIAAQRIASLNPKVNTSVYDLNHFPALRDKYNVMSVPCLVVGDKITFGKKNISQLIDYIMSV